MDYARRFAKTRAAHKRETAEDYVETVLQLIEETGAARLTELAGRLGIAHPTASKALKRLETEKLLVIHPYQGITLTALGNKLARNCKLRHELIVDFLRSIGVDDETAESDAEGMEHHVSSKTLQAMKSHIKKK